MKKYVWCEDSASGYVFWTNLFSVVYSEYIVESKKNNSKLINDVEQIEDDSNIYYILIDSSVDNPDVLRELSRLKKYMNGKTNVRMIGIHSFEFVLLSFEYLEEWVFATHDDLKEKRSHLLKARQEFIRLINGDAEAYDLNKFKTDYGFDFNNNEERIAAKLLFEITRNTGFETDKSQIGQCFTTDCCEWTERQADDICGLDDGRLTLSEKMDQIISYSVLKAAFKEAGL